MLLDKFSENLPDALSKDYNILDTLSNYYDILDKLSKSLSHALLWIPKAGFKKSFYNAMTL